MRSIRAGVLVLAFIVGLVQIAYAAPQPSEWVDAWAASPQPGIVGLPPIPDTKPFADQTLREIIHPEAGGSRARVRLSNTFGDRPLVVGSAKLARRSAGPVVDADSVHGLTFGGQQGITVPVGAEVLSDPVDMRVVPDADLAVDIYLPQNTGAVSQHFDARQTSYVAAGNQTGAANLASVSTVTSWFFLSGVEVAADRPTSGIVAFGDSITDGTNSTLDANHRWPNYLAQRLGHVRYSVVDEGIAGNRLLHDILGPNALARFDRDVLTQPSAKYVVILIGINDIGVPGAFNRPDEDVTVQQIIQGYRQLIDRAHQSGLRIFAGTLLPVGGSPYDTKANETKRAEVNAWLRNNAGHRDGFDGVVDFDRAIQDPAQPNHIRPIYDSGDHVHPNDAGYQLMANTIDTHWFN